MLPLHVSQTVGLLRTCDSGRCAEKMLAIAIAYSLPLCSEDDNRRAVYLTFDTVIKALVSKVNEQQLINVTYVLELAYATYSERVKISLFPWAKGTSAMVEVFDDLDDDDIADWDNAMRQLLALFRQHLVNKE